ncbi:MAG: site-2 protease family protein [Archaeoglobaceae archaeon]
MVSTWLIALTVFIIYYAAVESLKSKGILERYGISAFGPILMIRTSRGLNFLERISKAKTFWRWVANLGIPAVFLGMIFMFVLIILMDFMLLAAPPPPSELTEPRNVLLIPGLNQFIPLISGLIGLIVTLIVHEFSHAILSRVEGVRVKSLGVLVALIPIGGFAEPDEEEMMDKTKTTRPQRIRIFSAGVISNFIVAALVFGLFMVLLGGLSSNGVYVSGAFEDYPAQEAGIKPGTAIFRINDTDTPDLETFQEEMRETRPGDVVKVYTYNETGAVDEYTLNLTKNPHEGSNGFMGVTVLDVLQTLKNMPSQLTTVEGWLMAISMPFTLFGGFTGVYMHAFEPTGIWENTGNLLFYVLNILYWTGWINFYVGLFNCLPAVPLDGGRVFHESFAGILSRRYGERGEEISMKLVSFLAFLIFASILFSVLIPNLGFLR